MKKVLSKIWGVALVASIAMGLSACQTNNSQSKVVVYVSVDRIYAEPILNEFAQKTGVQILPVYDVEATKTTGLAQRLIGEQQRPQADVFWSGEVAQTLLLKEKAVLQPYKSAIAKDLPSQYVDPEGYWTGIGGRARVLMINTKLLPIDQAPQSLQDLLSTQWDANKIGIAYPLFGTSATHAAALYATWGQVRAKTFYEDLQKRGVRVVDGNSVVRDLVVNGQLSIGLTDTDDACSAVDKGEPVKIIIPDQGQDQMGTLVISGTVALIANAPHPQNGKVLIDYLVSREVEQKMMAIGASQLPLYKNSDISTGTSGNSTCLANAEIKGMSVKAIDIYRQLETSKQDMSRIFVR